MSTLHSEQTRNKIAGSISVQMKNREIKLYEQMMKELFYGKEGLGHIIFQTVKQEISDMYLVVLSEENCIKISAPERLKNELNIVKKALSDVSFPEYYPVKKILFDKEEQIKDSAGEARIELTYKFLLKKQKT